MYLYETCRLAILAESHQVHTRYTYDGDIPELVKLRKWILN